MLSFGYNDGLVDVRAAWGARWIVTQAGHVDCPFDRTSVFGDKADVDALIAWMNAPISWEPGATPFRRARDNASQFLAHNVISTREAQPVILHDDNVGAIIGNTKASAGYLYVAAYLYEHLPEGHPTRGLEKVLGR